MRALLALTLLVSTARAEIYIWKDARGVEHYSSSPPEDDATKKKMTVMKSSKKATASVVNRAAVAAPREPTETPEAPVPAAKPPQSHTIELYTTSWCPHCREARAYLSQRGLAFQDFDIENDAQAYTRYRSRGGHGIPLAVIDGAAITGFSTEGYDRLLR